MINLRKLVIFLSVFLSFPLFADKFWSGEKVDFYLSLGNNIGATTPLQSGNTVVKLKEYYPGINPSFGVNFVYWCPKNLKWGLSSGLILELKGFESTTLVSNWPFSTSSSSDDEEALKGFFRGENSMKIRNGYATLPLQIAYRTCSRSTLYFGGYLGYALTKAFNIQVIKGSFREKPGGDKSDIKDINLNSTKDLSTFDAGLMLANDFYLRKGMSLKLGVSWGLLPIIGSSPDSSNNKMYNIYFNSALCYRW